MSVSATVAINALAPEACILNVTPGTSGLDLSTVLGAVFLVRGPVAGGLTTWTCSLSNQTTNTLTLSHPYLAGDVSVLALYEVYAVMTTASGPVKTTSLQLTVVDPFVQ